MIPHHQAVLDIEAETAGLYSSSPDSLATLALLGGFVQPRRYEGAPYSWEEHRAWVTRNSNRNQYRDVSTGWEHQVYVVNTTHAETEMREQPYVCRSLKPLGDGQKLPLFHKGFICAGRAGNNSYYTTFRPEDIAEKENPETLMRAETFGAKLYFCDKSRFKKGVYPSGTTDVILTARIRHDEVIAFRQIVRTNAWETGGHGRFTKCDISYRGYEKDMKDWKIARWSPDRFEQSGNTLDSLIDEARYHDELHLLIYNLITKKKD